MILLFFIYVDIVISRYCSRIIVNLLFLFYRCDGYCITRMFFSRITFFFFYNNDIRNFKIFINNNHILLISYLINRNRYFLFLLSQYMFKFK